jgi:hypothetical protein
VRPHFLKRIALLLLFLALALALAFLWCVYNDPFKPDVRHKIFGNQKRLDDFLASQQVTAQRLHYRSGTLNPWVLESYDKGIIVPVAPAQYHVVQQLLPESTSYPWDRAKACLPDYGVLLTFSNQQSAVQIAICFACQQIGVFDNNSAAPLNTIRDFDPIYTQLVAVAKAIFPNDSEIQALK